MVSKSNTRFVQLLKERKICCHQSKIHCINMLWRKKTIVDSFKVVGDFYYNKDSSHGNNGRMYVSKHIEYILSLIQYGVRLGFKKKSFNLSQFFQEF